MRSLRLVACTLLVTAACVPDGRDTVLAGRMEKPKDPAAPETAPEAPGVQLAGLSVRPAKVDLAVGESRQLAVTATYDDGSTREVANECTWSSPAAAFVTVSGSGALLGVSEGTAVVTATFQGIVARSTVTITPAGTAPPPMVVDRVEVEPSMGQLSANDTLQLVATAFDAQGTAREVTTRATWSSSEPRIASVDTAGMVRAVSGGRAYITAELDGKRARSTIDVSSPPPTGNTDAGVVTPPPPAPDAGTTTMPPPTGPCTYPAGTRAIRVGSVMPALQWMQAFKADGTRIDLSLEQFACGQIPDLARYNSIHFIVGAEWCPACPDYIRDVSQQAAQIDAAGGLIVYVETQNTSYSPDTTASADRYLRRMIGTTPGLRVGDGETMPRSAIYNAPIVRSFPTAFVVRKRDMKLIADQGTSGSMLPFVRIAQNPDNWSTGGGTTFTPHCTAMDEEPGEPNDAIAQATAIQPGTFTGGICTDAPDFFQVNLTTRWRIDLAFTHATADLDVYVWDPSTDDAVRDASNRKIGSYGESDTETFTYQGPALIKVVGYRSGSAPYRFTLTGL